MTDETMNPEQSRVAADCPNERLVIPVGADPVGTPPKSFRYEMGQPATVGELRRLLDEFPDEEMLMFRNGPLPTIYVHHLRGDKYIEFDWKV